MAETDIREAAAAGTFYPRAVDDLRHTVEDLLSHAREKGHGGVRGIIAPHAGYIYSGSVAAEAFAALKPLKNAIKRIVIIGPAHFVSFRGIAAPSVRAFATPLGEVPLDVAAIGSLVELPQIVIDDVPHAFEHALEVELPFLQFLFGPIPVIPLVVGVATVDEVADVLSRLWDTVTLLVVSSDLSHYHDYETARRRDAETAKAIERCDEGAIGLDDACGSLALRGMLIEAKRRGLAIERLDLRNSGDTAGDHRRVVGYGAWIIHDG